VNKKIYLNGSIWGPVVLVILLLASPSYAQRYTTLPQFVSGDGWSCDIFLTNQSAQAISGLVISFYGNDGLPITVSTSIGSGASFTVSLDPGASRVIRIPSSGSIKVGYAIIKAPTPGSVTVTEVFRSEQSGTVVADLGVPQLGKHNHYSFPVEVNIAQGVNTGLALANPTYDSSAATAQTLIVNLFNTNGTLFRRALVPLTAGAHISKYLNEADLFSGLDNFVGYASISGTQSFGVLGLRQDKQAYGAITVDYGSILSSFAVSSPVVAEAESNNSSAQAQLLTGTRVISGSFSSAGDVDYFVFDGKKGDIVSFMTNTQGLSSSADTVLTLYLADGVTSYAASDQNGLYGQNDSLIHTVLPSDGRYYIKVSEYYGNGGSKYGYQLQATFPGTGALSTQPIIASLSPVSSAQGTTTTLTISGSNLANATSVAFSPSDGITATNIQATGTQVTCQVQVSSAAATSARQVTVSTPSGTSNSLSFTVASGSGGSYDGSWTGNTSAGTIKFTVTNNKIMSFEVVQNFVFSCCTVTKLSASLSGLAIAGNSFTLSHTTATPSSYSFTFSGTFSSASQASGTFSGVLNAPAGTPCCAGPFSTSWTASRSAMTEMPAAEVDDGGTITNVFVDETGNTVGLTFQRDDNCPGGTPLAK
jgi:hypothetical protein